MMEVTIFKNLFSKDVPFIISLEKAMKRIKEGKSKDRILKIRGSDNEDVVKREKNALPAILFSGKFRDRSKKGLEEHSGLMTLDFDDFESEEVYSSMFEELKSNKHVVMLFRSPSGNGIKAIVKIPKCDDKDHERYFRKFEKEFDYDYFDKSTCDVSRACFESYDPNLYYNPKAEVYAPILEDIGYKVSEKLVITPVTNEEEIIERILSWNWKYDFVKGERNNYVYALSRAFCEYGVTITKAEEFLVNSIKEKDFTEREIRTTIKSAYQSSSFGIKKFENKDKRREFNDDLKHKTKKEVLEKYNIDEATYESEKNDSAVDEFWYYEENSKGEPKLKISNYDFKIFLEQNGFKKTYIEDSHIPSFVKVKSNVVEETSTKKIKDFVMTYLDEKKERKPWNLLSKATSYFSENYLDMIDTIELMMLRDTRNKSYIAFRNGILEVSKDSLKLLDYIDIDGYIWKSHIIDRDFEISEKTDNDYKKFIYNISGRNPKALEATLGYLICTYKNKINNKAVIFNDETISDNPEGGTGKGLIVQGVKQIRRTSILDGKTFDDKKSFPYQTVSKDTQVLVFDDVKKNWDFESKFSLVTEGMTLERKNKDAIKLSVEDSPKMVISTNYVIRGAGNSHDRRRHEIEIAQYYGYNKTPFDDFGKQLFDEWDEKEFLAFDNYMVKCLQLYLSEGLIPQENAKNIETRKFIAETNKEFFEWANDGNIPIGTRIYRNEKYNEFITDYPDYGNGRYRLSQKSFKIYLDAWAKFLGHETKEGRDHMGRYTEILGEYQNNDGMDEPPF